jgi:acetoin utilization deacetylase AcuC-like enzyme
MVSVFYSPSYVCSGFSFDTTRKAGWIADSLNASPMPGIALIEPKPLERDQVLSVHDPGYVSAVETGVPRELAESQGFSWDAGLWPMVLASNGGAVAAALAALEQRVAGSLSSGLHHAHRTAGAGFCTFNGLVIAAQEALAAGAQSVLILDLDAHCGGGTESLIADDPRIWQVDVSVNSYDSYDSSDRIWLKFAEEDGDYLPVIQGCLQQLADQGPGFDLCLYNAGMDPFEGCPTGGKAGITNEILSKREEMVFAWCKKQHMPVAFVLAGGYIGSRLDEAELVSLHRLTLAAALANA